MDDANEHYSQLNSLLEKSHRLGPPSIHSLETSRSLRRDLSDINRPFMETRGSNYEESQRESRFRGDAVYSEWPSTRSSGAESDYRYRDESAFTRPRNINRLDQYVEKKQARIDPTVQRDYREESANHAFEEGDEESEGEVEVEESESESEESEDEEASHDQINIRPPPLNSLAPTNTNDSESSKVLDELRELVAQLKASADHSSPVPNTAPSTSVEVPPITTTSVDGAFTTARTQSHPELQSDAANSFGEVNGSSRREKERTRMFTQKGRGEDGDAVAADADDDWVSVSRPPHREPVPPLPGPRFLADSIQLPSADRPESHIHIHNHLSPPHADHPSGYPQLPLRASNPQHPPLLPTMEPRAASSSWERRRGFPPLSDSVDLSGLTLQVRSFPTYASCDLLMIAVELADEGAHWTLLTNSTIVQWDN